MVRPKKFLILQTWNFYLFITQYKNITVITKFTANKNNSDDTKISN